jgi:hypothetical protein
MNFVADANVYDRSKLSITLIYSHEASLVSLWSDPKLNHLFYSCIETDQLKIVISDSSVKIDGKCPQRFDLLRLLTADLPISDVDLVIS